MEIHCLLDSNILRDNPFRGSGLGAGYAMSELESLLDYSINIRDDRELGGFYNREYYRPNVSFLFFSVMAHVLTG